MLQLNCHAFLRPTHLPERPDNSSTPRQLLHTPWRFVLDRFPLSPFGNPAPHMGLPQVFPFTPLRPYLHKRVAPGVSLKVLLLWLLATPVQFGFGMRFHLPAYAALRRGSSNMDVLVALGSGASSPAANLHPNMACGSLIWHAVGRAPPPEAKPRPRRYKCMQESNACKSTNACKRAYRWACQTFL